MPFSLDPQPGENEFECARCGALIPYDVTRCPVCGVNLYEPEDEEDEERARTARTSQAGLLSRIGDFIRRVTGKPYKAEEVFGDALNQAILYNDLLLKIGGDRDALERLVQFEKKLAPDGNRYVWLENAIQHWERDNRASGSDQ
jgi:hypothetical protein